MSDLGGRGPGVAVLVVNYRTPGATVRAVRSVVADPEVAEVVVVDNASGDGSAEELREAFAGAPAVVVVAAPTNLGFGRGVNLAARRSRAPLLLVLNSDAEVGEPGIGPLVGALAHDPGAALVAPEVRRPDGTPQPDAYGRLPRLGPLDRGWGRPGPGDDARPGWVSGVAMLVRREDFEAVGGFDPDFAMYLEDVDLCRRLAARGRWLAREPGAVVTHVGGASTRSRADRVALYHASKVRYLEKAGAGWGPVTLARAVAVGRVGAARLAARLGDRHRGPPAEGSPSRNHA